MTKYIEIAEDIKNDIFKGKYLYGQKLPYEYELCKKYHCNKETMKKALATLVENGLIIRRRGSGTFVKDNRNDNNDSKTTYIQGLSKAFQGLKEVISDVFVFEIIAADDTVAKKLKINRGESVYHIIRGRRLEGIPYSIEIIYLPMNIISNLKMEHIKGSIYQHIEKTLQLKIQSNHLNIISKQSSELEQEYLGLKSNEPYIEVEQIAYLNNGSIFQYALSRFNYRDFKFETVIINK